MSAIVGLLHLFLHNISQRVLIQNSWQVPPKLLTSHLWTNRGTPLGSFPMEFVLPARVPFHTIPISQPPKARPYLSGEVQGPIKRRSQIV